MLINVTATAIKGEPIIGSSMSIIVNSERMYSWQDETSGSSFYYVMNPYDRREKAKHITISESISEKLSAANTAWGDKIVDLPVVSAVGGTDTDSYIPVKDIAYAIAYDGETDYCWVWFNEGGYRTRKVLVPFSLTDLTYVGSTGTSSA